MGGDIATLLCASDKKNKIVKFVNIEGSITQFDLFISQEAVKAAESGNFTNWFCDEFMTKKVLEDWGENILHAEDTILLYVIAAWKHFWQMPGSYVRETGHCWENRGVKPAGCIALSIPKVFCYGTESVSSGTIDFLKENKLEYQAFDDAFHWLMIDKAKEFYSFLFEFIYT